MSFFFCVICVFFFCVTCVFFWLFRGDVSRNSLLSCDVSRDLCLFFVRYLCLFFLAVSASFSSRAS